MARSGRARKQKPRQPDGRVRPENIQPTPETMAKLTADPLRIMVEKGYLNSDAERAADEVRAIYLAVCKDVMASTMKYNRRPPGKREIPDYLDTAHAQRFVPWAYEHKGIMDAVLRIVVEREDPGRHMWFPVARALQDYAKRMENRRPATLDAVFPI